VSTAGPTQEYLDAVGKELRVGRRYRRRILTELADHIEEGSERERRHGMSAEQAQRRAIERVGGVATVAEHFSTTHRDSRASMRGKGIRLTAYLGVFVVLACITLAPLAAGDSDSHLGLEISATIAAALAVLLLDLSVWASQRVSALLAGVVGVWIAAAVVLVRDGDALFCGQVFAGVLIAAALLSAARRVTMRPRRGDL
jgi:hypothetical protein